jgi:ElaB/YqjD/DUF883 family membrane-anchored ribosome-binding protein
MAVGNNPSHGTQKFENAKDKGQNVADKARDMASNLTDRARDAASNLGDKARDAASNLGDKARDTATALKDRAEDAIGTVSDKMSSLADNVREGPIGEYASNVSDSIKAGTKYFQDHDLQDMGQDVTRLVRQYPIQALLVGFGVGCLMGMTFSRR